MQLDPYELPPIEEPLLFQRYPSLKAALPWTSLTHGPTPVHRLERLEERLPGCELWIKRDDLSHPEYGGNKPRKLEFLLAEALARGARQIITFGALGSNHALATTIAARRLGLETLAILLPEPLSPALLQTLRTTHAQGASLVLCPHELLLAAVAAWQWGKSLLQGKKPYLIFPGGSSALGSLGYVNAALELKDQIESAECPTPDAIFVPVGSNGTLAGLALGCKIAGIDSRLIGVRVSHFPTISPPFAARLSNQCGAILDGATDAQIPKVRSKDLQFEWSYLGRGYAHPTAEGRAAIALLEELEGIPLEEVYTGKAFAAFLDACQMERGKRLMFWNTYNSRPHAPLLPEAHDYRQLPAAFHRFFETKRLKPQTGVEEGGESAP